MFFPVICYLYGVLKDDTFYTFYSKTAQKNHHQAVGFSVQDLTVVPRIIQAEKDRYNYTRFIEQLSGKVVSFNLEYEVDMATRMAELRLQQDATDRLEAGIEPLQ